MNVILEGLNLSSDSSYSKDNINFLHINNLNETQTSVIIYLKNLLKANLDNKIINKQDAIVFLKKIADLMLFRDNISDKNAKNLCIVIEELMNYKLIKDDCNIKFNFLF